ncbi:type III secretion system gatekeeper subunit SctW [Pseudomonas khavaziana]|uniref:Type III secretion system gatekeeper subunit SctW n=1 Tax=Pseudomonas khavaziana TaxID=2842351 RepID=A0ABZ2DNF4_9PSED
MIEPSSGAQKVQQQDPPAITQPPKQEPVSGVDVLAHLFNEEVANNSQALSQRKLSVRVAPIEQMTELYRQLGHPAKRGLAIMCLLTREALRQGADVNELLALSEGDPARAFVVLEYVAAQADKEARPSEATLARDAIAKLQVSFKGEIQAGLNIALAMQAASTDPQERQALRTLYYASVVTRQSLATMMQALLGVYGGERFADGLKVMRKALADDIAATVSSMPTPLLRSLLLGLQSCGQLGGVLAGCQALVQRLGISLDATSLLQRLLNFAGIGITAAEILQVGDELAGGTDARKLVSLNALYPLVQQMPLAVWTDKRVREEALRIFLAVMGELDRVTRGPAGLPIELRALP